MMASNYDVSMWRWTA